MHGVLAAGQGGASAWPGTMAEESDECVGTNSQKNPTNSQKNPPNSQRILPIDILSALGP